MERSDRLLAVVQAVVAVGAAAQARYVAAPERVREGENMLALEVCMFLLVAYGLYSAVSAFAEPPVAVATEVGLLAAALYVGTAVLIVLHQVAKGGSWSVLFANGLLFGGFALLNLVLWLRRRVESGGAVT